MEVLSDVLGWAHEHVRLLFGWAGIWVATFVLTLWAVRWYLLRVPADYFAHEHKPLDYFRSAHPVLRWTLLIGKNLIGAILLISGLVMLVTPGPGWLAVLVGLAFVDLPGKRAIERWILSRPTILKLVNQTRAKAGRPPLAFTLDAPAAH